MRWFLIGLLLITACANDAVTGNSLQIVVSSYDTATDAANAVDAVQAANAYGSDATKTDEDTIPKPPNTTQRGTSRDLSCSLLGCNDHTQAIGDQSSSLFYPCSCKDASKVRFEDIICFRSFTDAYERHFTRAKVCD
jgi:hypothetical protein